MGIKIGNNNKIKKSIIAENMVVVNSNAPKSKNNFLKNHPIISSIIASVIAGAILMFSFWERIVSWAEGIF